MTLPRRLLVCIDRGAGERLVLEQAARVCRSGRGRLHLVAALPEAPWPVRLLQGQGPDPGALVGRLREHLGELAVPFVREGLQVSTDVLRGTPFVALIGQVLGGRFDLVIKSAEGQDGSFFGSTALHLVRKCPCPVWIVAPAPAQGPRRVLAAIDPDPFDPVRARLAESVLRTARQVAELDGSELHVAYAWTAWGEGGLRGPAAPAQLDAYRSAIARVARQQVTSFLGRTLPDLPADRVHLTSGEPGPVLAERSRALRAHTMVLGTVGRVGTPGVLIGSSAESALSLLGCSVVALKPEGFATPVAPHSAME